MFEGKGRVEVGKMIHAEIDITPGQWHAFGAIQCRKDF
jgi:hypothetical protein